MDRRDALKTMFAGFVGAMGFGMDTKLSLRMRTASAQTLNQKTMVFIFQRGGCDGLSVTVPYADANYYTLRPNISIPAPDATNYAAALDLNGSMGLSPALQGMYDIFQEDNLAVLPAVHYNNASRSHFDSQFIIETGSNDLAEGGFMNRYLELEQNGALFRAVSMGTSVADMLRGDVVVPAVDYLDGLGFDDNSPNGCTEYNVLEKLEAAYAAENEPAENERDNRTLVYNQTKKMFEDLEVFEQFEEDYQPANGAVYPDGSYGRHLRIIAQLIKEGVGLELASVGIGGWDTHSGQGNSQNPDSSLYSNLDYFSDGVRALYQDLGTLMTDVVIVTGTEFGRTSQENANGGTDHGHAAAWFAAGGNINGGIYGDFPGLAPEQLNEGRYLDHNIDYRDILTNIMRDHLGQQDLSSIFPGHTYNPLGLMA